MSVIFAVGVVVTGDPVFVVSAAGVDHNRFVPMEPVGRSAHGYVVSLVANGQTANQPHAMFRVINYRGIAGRRVGSILVIDGQAGKGTVGPGFAAIGGSRKTEISAAAVGYASYLKSRDHR